MPSVIDYKSRVPPFRQLAAILRGQIERGEWPDRLPGERQLQQEYGVALVTIRKAMQLLRDEGLVDTVPGWGSFVIPPEERGKPGPGAST